MRTKVESLKEMEFKKMKEICLTKWKELSAEEKKVFFDESYSKFSNYKK